MPNRQRHLSPLNPILKHPDRILLCLVFLLASLSAVSANAGSKVLKITPQKDGDEIHFFVENLEATDVTTTFELDLENLKCSKALPYTCTLLPHQNVEVFVLSPAHKGDTWNYTYTSRYTMGSSIAVHDDSYVYTLPYSTTSGFRVSQGYNGTFSHTGPDQYATDFKMPVGTHIHAAREGVIVKVKTDSNIGGSDRKYENCANYILIRHSDGTLANYAHLKKDGAVVKVGQFVKAGELIGYSGNTGFSSGPHLHFSVFKTKSGSQRQTLPVKFKVGDDSVVTLVEGKTYKSSPGSHATPILSIVPGLVGSHKATGSGSPGARN